MKKLSLIMAVIAGLISSFVIGRMEGYKKAKVVEKIVYREVYDFSQRPDIMEKYAVAMNKTLCTPFECQDQRIKETDQRIKETDQRIKETDQRIKELEMKIKLKKLGRVR